MDINYENLPKNLAKALIVENTFVSSTTIRFVLRDEGNFNFVGGQFVSLVVPKEGKWLNRAYSIASSPEDKNQIVLYIRIEELGAAGKYLPSLKVGEYIHYRKAAGKFLFTSRDASTIQFVCTGTGIAPFYAMLCELKAIHQKFKKLRVLSGFRNESEILMREEFDGLGFSNLSWDIVLSRPSEKWAGLKGYVTDHLLMDPDAQHYLCGREEMINTCKQKFLDANLKKESVFEESYGKAFSG